MEYPAERDDSQPIHTTELSDVFNISDGNITSRGDAVWRVRLELGTDPGTGLTIRLMDDVILGIGNSSDNAVDLSPLDARRLGVSRRHARLWTTGTGLFLIDLNSTNGTILNGHRLNPGTPFHLGNGDALSLGNLDLIVRVVHESKQKRAERDHEVDLSGALMEIAKTITSEIELDEVLDRALATAMALTSAAETAIWLVDEKTNELFLEAERGIEDESVRLMRLPVDDPHVRRVFDTGQPLRVSRRHDGDLVKVKTGYMVEALLYVPLVTAGRTLGVIAAAQRETGKMFSVRDEHVIAAIADFAAIALHNAQLYDTVLQADRIKEEMIQNISHEYRTPLHLIMGYLAVTLEEADSLPSDLADYLQIVARQAERLKWLTENVVSLTSVEARASQRSEQDVIPLLVQCVDDARIQAAERTIKLTFESAIQSAPVAVNQMAFEQIMSNLLSNALKFTPLRGKVTVRVEQASTGNDVLISVMDTGIGIPEEAHEFIFERFVQLDGSIRREYGGVGLGLSVVKSLVEAHGGVVWVESVPDEGSTFSFTLPLSSSAVAAAPEPSL
jgi:two-component system NtrC family sensor kinase